MLGPGGSPTPFVFSISVVHARAATQQRNTQGLCHPPAGKSACGALSTALDRIGGWRNGKKKIRGLKHPLSFGVSDGTRTRDIQDHNLTLYQLNYTHHCRQTRSGDVDTSCSGPWGPNPFPPALPVRP